MDHIEELFLDKINEVRCCIKNGFLYLPLALSSTFPDICSKIQFPSIMKESVRYANWFDTYVNIIESDPNSGIHGFKGEDCYRLRCEYLHSGKTTPVDTHGNCNYSFFILSDDNISFSVPNPGLTDVPGDYTSISIPVLCDRICSAAEQFYTDTADKSLLSDYIKYTDRG